VSSWISLAGWILLSAAVALLGGYANSYSVYDWYPQLQKPSFNPPSWVFAPVWTTLYAVMAVAAWRVNSRVPLGHPAILAYWVQIALNLAWSVLFFGMREIGWALADIAALLAAIGAAITLFFRVDRAAALLMIPYFWWVSFAAVLNYEIWRLNPS
jgi:translocator protein